MHRPTKAATVNKRQKNHKDVTLFGSTLQHATVLSV